MKITTSSGLFLSFVVCLALLLGTIATSAYLESQAPARITDANEIRLAVEQPVLLERSRAVSGGNSAESVFKKEVSTVEPYMAKGIFILGALLIFFMLFKIYQELTEHLRNGESD